MTQLNEKLLAKQNEIKSQTFGVEIEMNNIRRSEAARIAAEYFGTDRYTDTHFSDGYMTWSAFDAQGRKWKFSRDVSIEGPCDEQCEMVTPVLHYDDMELLQGLIRVLRKNGAKSSPSRGCGVHIHVGGDGHTAKSIRNLCNFMARYETTLAKMIQIPAQRMRSYCNVINPIFLSKLNAEKPKTLDEVKEIWYVSQGSYVNSSHYDQTRYHMLNLHAFWNRYHTVEFRMFQFDNPTADRKGGLHAGQLKAMIQLCLAINWYAKYASTISNTPRTDVTDVQQMATMFGNLRMRGDEFKTAREYFTRNCEMFTAERTAQNTADSSQIDAQMM